MTQALSNPKAYYADSLSAAPDAIRGFYLALTEQDSDGLRAVLSDAFTFAGPLASLDSPDAFVKMAAGFGGWVETSRIIVDGDQVAHTFTYHMTAPSKADIPMCEVFELKDGKLLSSRAYNNPADFPA